MKLLTVAVLLCALPALTQTYCYRWHPEKNETHCQDMTDKTWHEVNSNWKNSKCHDCSCGSCCHSVSVPTGFASDCVLVFNQTLCHYVVHKRDDPNTFCESTGGFGM